MKDIRFTDKKIDDSWKEQTSKEREAQQASARPPAASGEPAKTSKIFLNLLSSLGYQAMVHLGEIAHPQTGQPMVDLQSAKEAIDLLAALKEKTQHNLSPEESQVFETVLPELQLKFSRLA